MSGKVRRRSAPRIGRKAKYKHKYAEMSPDQELEERAKARERMIIYREKKIEVSPFLFYISNLHTFMI